MNKFKISDKVRVVADEKRLRKICNDATLTGREGVVKRYWDMSDIGLPWLVDLSSRLLWFDSQDIELVEAKGADVVALGVGYGAGKKSAKEEPTVVGHPARTFIGHPDGTLAMKPLEDAPLIRTFESGAKDTNPKDALGVKKVPTSTLPTGPMYEVALAMLEGARKYGRHNYRTFGVKASVYYDAALRHITAWWEGEDIDEASGIHHLMKAAACLFVVRDSMLMKNWIDDRPPQYPKQLDVERLNELTQGMIKKYPECTKPFCHRPVDRTAPVPKGY